VPQELIWKYFNDAPHYQDKKAMLAYMAGRGARTNALPRRAFFARCIQALPRTQLTAAQQRQLQRDAWRIYRNQHFPIDFKEVILSARTR
jgi:hypothetical protein